MNAAVVMSSPSGLLGPCGGKTGPPVTLSPFPVKHALSAAILVTTAREPAGITSGLNGTQVLACSSVSGLGVDRASADPEHLNRRPSVNTNRQELTPARRLTLVAVDEQLTDVTSDAGMPRAAVGDAPDDVELTPLPHPAPFTANTIAMATRRV